MLRKLKALIALAGLCLSCATVIFVMDSASFGAMAPYCQPACNACQRCIQLRSPNGVLLPPACAPKSPRPPGCP